MLVEIMLIEIDGSQHFYIENKIKDMNRTKYLEKYGLIIVRYNNMEVFENIEGVIENLYNIVIELKKSPSR